MKNIFIAMLVAAFSATYAQDTIKVTQLEAVQVIGIKTDSREPSTSKRTVCDSVQFLNTQRDPFFVLDKISPSIYAQSDNGQGTGYSYMRLRGFDQTRINFNLNGIPLNEMEDQGIYFSNMPGFYNYLSSVNVQRGVGSSRYGNTSVGGSVDMETRDMFKKDLQLSTLGVANLANRFINGTYSSGTMKNGMAFQIGSSYAYNEGFRDHSYNEGGSIFYGLGYRNENNIFKAYGFSGVSRNQLAFYGVPKDVLDQDYETNLNSPEDKDDFNQNFMAANWINHKGDVKFNTSTYFNNVTGTYNTGGIDFGVNSHQYGLMSNAVYENSKRVINMGINANIYKRDHYGSDNGGYYDLPENSTRYQNTGYKNDLAAYIKGTEKLQGGFNLFWDMQIRKVWMKVTSQEQLDYSWLFFNPKGGIKRITEKGDSWLSVAMTQREPTRTDMFQRFIQENSLSGANPDNSTLITSNSTLSPERVVDIEVGHKVKMKKSHFSANLFMMRVTNEFLATGRIDQYSGFMEKTPFKSTLRYGFESEGSIGIEKINFFYTFQQMFSRNDEGMELTFAPGTISTVGLAYKDKKFTGGAYAQFVGSMATSLVGDQTFSKSYTIINGFIGYQLPGKLSLNMNFGNIANSKYYIPAGSFMGSGTFYAGQLFNWNLSLNYKL